MRGMYLHNLEDCHRHLTGRDLDECVYSVRALRESYFMETGPSLFEIALYVSAICLVILTGLAIRFALSRRSDPSTNV